MAQSVLHDCFLHSLRHMQAVVVDIAIPLVDNLLHDGPEASCVDHPKDQVREGSHGVCCEARWSAEVWCGPSTYDTGVEVYRFANGVGRGRGRRI